MGEEASSLSRLTSQIRNIGYYAGLTFGIGYCLVLIGIIAVIAEITMRLSDLSRYLGYVGAQIPSWLIAALASFFLGIICAIYFGVTIIRNSKSAKDYGLKLDTIASSVSAFSFMLIFVGIGIIILVAAAKQSLFSPICGVVGPILLLIGFRAYRGEASESKLVGAILMLVSVALIYFVAYRGGILGLLSAGVGLLGLPWPGPLLSEQTLEAIALLIAIVCGVIFAFPILEGKLKQSVAGIILSISGILFSLGVIYFNFSAVSTIDKLNQLLSLAGSISSGLIPGFPRLTLDSIWIVFFGFLLLGISGIIALIAACLPLVISAKQLSTRLEARPKAPEVASPQPVVEVKYCTKCGASMPADATYCLKCGQKQPEGEEI